MRKENRRRRIGRIARGMCVCIYVVACCVGIGGCSDYKAPNGSVNFINQVGEDPTLTIISTNQPNGYTIKFIQRKEKVLMNLSRGDSINRTLEINAIPTLLLPKALNLKKLSNSNKDAIVYCDVNIPVVQEIIPPNSADQESDYFFMDVNFDGEKELLVEGEGYNTACFTCYDLINGSVDFTTGLLQPIDEPPFDNIVSSYSNIPEAVAVTEFDYDKKTIHIYQSFGCCAGAETWCEMVDDNPDGVPRLQIVRKKEVETMHGVDEEVYRITTLYKRVDGNLKKISTTREKL